MQDIAVLTDDVSQCRRIQRESQNVAERWHCRVKDRYVRKFGKRPGTLPLDKDACEVSGVKVTGSRSRRDSCANSARNQAAYRWTRRSAR